MVRNNNSLDYIIANYAYGFLKKEFVETLPITISAQNLKEEQAVEKARSLVIDTLTNLYYHLEEKYPITRENLEFTPLEPELIIGGKSK
ncbi:MAG TPA: hypothetical protein EYH09_01290, partial [Candidatus Nanopusillus sp.]|nr:hypothetical protein [Candidatus Nanopusillus sp.]